MSHKMLRPFIVKVSVLGYSPLYSNEDGRVGWSYQIMNHDCDDCK